jgi:ribonuclease HII
VDFLKVAGIDEAGRGPLAGPVVAAAVILPRDHGISGINDSKKLSPKQRDRLYAEILCVATVGVGIVSSLTIDQINILQATFQAMREAVAALLDTPLKLLVDGNQRIPNLLLDQEAIIGGDGKHECIGAASIIAKVTRDRMMLDWDVQYPQYGFAKHKGYGTALHCDAIRTHGLSPIHRRSFCGSFIS